MFHGKGRRTFPDGSVYEGESFVVDTYFWRQILAGNLRGQR